MNGGTREMAESAKSGWASKAECRNVEPEIFFGSEDNPEPDVEMAKAICSQCEVRSTCLEFALDNNEMFGVWGGLDEDERRKLKRERRSHERIRREAMERLERDRAEGRVVTTRTRKIVRESRFE